MGIRLAWTVMASVVALTACGRKGSSQTTTALPTHVTLALNWVAEPEFGGFYAARESGAYAERGLNVEVRGGSADVPVLQLVATDRVEFATVGADDLVIARARGADVVAVFATFQTSPQCIMTHAERNLTKIEDVFQSGTVALETGLSFVKFLKTKFKWGNATVVPYDGGIARFLVDPNFSQQGYATSEPIAATRAGAHPKTFLIADAGFDPYDTVVITSRKFADSHADVVRNFVAATRDGWNAYLNDPAPTNAVLGKLNPSMDAATFAAVAVAQKPFIRTAETATIGLGGMTAARWNTLSATLVQLALVPKAPGAEQLFTELAAP